MAVDTFRASAITVSKLTWENAMGCSHSSRKTTKRTFNPMLLQARLDLYTTGDDRPR